MATIFFLPVILPGELLCRSGLVTCLGQYHVSKCDGSTSLRSTCTDGSSSPVAPGSPATMRICPVSLPDDERHTAWNSINLANTLQTIHIRPYWNFQPPDNLPSDNRYKRALWRRTELAQFRIIVQITHKIMILLNGCSSRPPCFRVVCYTAEATHTKNTK